MEQVQALDCDELRCRQSLRGHGQAVPALGELAQLTLVYGR